MGFSITKIPFTDDVAEAAIQRSLLVHGLDEAVQNMSLGVTFLKSGSTARKEHRVAQFRDGSRVLIPRLCPHQGSPIRCGSDHDCSMIDAWHGSQFDALMGVRFSEHIKGRLARARACI
jgi:nitrite reductase/ring-hydroxylating ferredoxin subunit